MAAFYKFIMIHSVDSNSTDLATDNQTYVHPLTFSFSYRNLLVFAHHDHPTTTEAITSDGTCSAITSDFEDSDRNGEWRRFSTCNGHHSYKHVDNDYYMWCEGMYGGAGCFVTWMTGTHCGNKHGGYFYFVYKPDDWLYYGGKPAHGSITWYACTDSGAQSEGLLDFENIEGIGAMIGSASDNVVVTVTAKDLLILGLLMVNVLSLTVLICRCTKYWNGNRKKMKYDFEAVALSENESLQN